MGALTTKAPTVRVYTAKAWQDPWEEQPGLWCNFSEFAASPSMPVAQLQWKYGYGTLADDDVRETKERLDIKGYYVKIAVDAADADTPIDDWCGRVIEEHDLREGADWKDGESIARGVQTFVCWGMESELDLDPLIRSMVLDAVGDEMEIGRAIGFNLGGGRPQDRNIGGGAGMNRSYGDGSRGCPVFVNDLDWYVSKWSARDIIEYLLEYYGPKDVDNATPITFKLDEAANLKHLETDYPALHVEGMTVRGVLDQLMDRRRGLGWRVRVDDYACLIVPFTHTDEDITLESGLKIPANQDTLELDFDHDPDVQQAVVRETEATRYDQVIVRGEPIGAVFTTSSKYGAIDKDWTALDLLAYNVGAANETGYGALNREQRGRRNALFRSGQTGVTSGQPRRVQRVWSWFRLKKEWDGSTEDGVGGGGGYAFRVATAEPNGYMQEDVNFSYSSNFWPPGITLQKLTPLFEHEDYSGTRAADGSIDAQPMQREFMPPLLLLKIGTRDSADVYCPVHKLAGQGGPETMTGAGRGWSCHLRMRDDLAGFTLQVTGDSRQHMLGKTEFAADSEAAEIPADLDWKDNLIGTFYVLGDDHVEVRYPCDDDVRSTADIEQRRIRRMLVTMPGAHLDHLVAHTVVGVKDGLPLRCDQNAVIRSDVARMHAVARLGYLWYGVDRRTLSLQRRRLENQAAVGQFLTTIGSGDLEQTINTVVTRVRYDFDGGLTTVQTSYCELDMKAM